MININDYIDRITSIQGQYNLAIYAIDRFDADTTAKENYINTQKTMLNMFLQNPSLVFSSSETGGKNAIAQSMIDYWKNRLPVHIEKIRKNLRQNTLILSLALFESFIKDLHREILLQEPKLLKPKREIPLGRLVSLGFDKVIHEEVEREVHSVDRESVDKRADYFSTKLGIPWSDSAEDIQKVKKLSDLRNCILHENSDEDVSEENLTTDCMVFLTIPTRCYVLAQTKYPKVFEELY